MSFPPTSRKVAPLHHPRLEVEGVIVDDEGPIPPMMQGSTLFPALIEPDPLRLEDKEIVWLRQPLVEDAALNIGEAIAQQWRGDICCGSHLKAKSFEFVDLVARTVSDVDDRLCQI